MKERQIKFIYWFAYYNLNSPSVRYRAKYPLEYFKEKKGIGYYLILPGYSLRKISRFAAAYISALFKLKKDSIIVIQRVSSNFIYSNLLKLLVNIRKPDTIYDLDDADYLENGSKIIYYFTTKCDTISAGSRKIGEHLKNYNSKIIHTTSPIVDLKIVKKGKNKTFTVGWIGGFGGEHKTSLISLVFPAIKELKFKIRLKILGVTKKTDLEFINKYFASNRNIEIEIPTNIDWNNENNIQNMITSFDIGIATLIDSEMQKSKSGIKAKQYMNNGVPVLSTKLPENDYVIDHGKNGFFCSTSNEFKQRIIDFHNMNEKEYEYYSKNARMSIVNFNHDMYLSELKRKNGTQSSSQPRQ